MQYILLADYHDNDFFALKFYPKPFRKSTKKYSLITNRGDLGNIVITCLKVIPLLLEKYPTASFGFAGARSFDPVNKKKNKKGKTIGRWEQLEENQRFKVYSAIVRKRIGDITFQHFIYKEISAYMLINRKCKNIDLKETIIKIMLSATYNHFSNR